MNWLILAILNHWLKLSVGFSFFWAIRAAIVWTNDPHVGLPLEMRKKVFPLAYICRCVPIFSMAAYQFIFNFVGSMAGWCCLYVVLHRHYWVNERYFQFDNLGWTDLLLFSLAVVGLTGHLPQFLYGLVESPKKGLEKIQEVLNLIQKKLQA